MYRWSSRLPSALGIMLVIVGSMLVAGCSENGPKRYRLQGTVEFDSKPVPAGTIYFDPDTAKGNKGPQGYATIVDGKFDTEKAGKGHVGGPMRIRIVGLASAVVATNDDSPKPPLFPEFVDAIDLEKSDDLRGFVIHKDYAGAPVQTAPLNNGP
jgi:hypothetical protein